jgi:hypothetical protein
MPTKSLIGIFLITIILFFTSCAGGEPVFPDIEIDTSVGLYSGEAENEPDSAEIASEAAVPRGPGIPIRWGTKLIATDIDAASPILQHFYDKFGADMSLLRVPYDLDSGDDIPDIFYGEAVNLYERGFTRTIPRDMIEIHAPDYAALLSSVPYGWEMGKVDGKDEYLGLYIYDVSRSYLRDYSAYRLDWMEQLNIQPPGDIVEIVEGVYFTESAFTYPEFLHVMRQFSVSDDLSDFDSFTRGMSLYLSSGGIMDFHTIHDPVASLLGMWGINLNNINEDGKAVPYFISDAYKEFLLFIRDKGHSNEDLIIYIGNESYPRGFPVSVPSQYEAGWSSLSLDYLPIVVERQLNLPDKRYLITPPEIGLDGKQGSAAKHSGTLFDTDGQWVINNKVSDQLLVSILQVFNAMAFDPETYVITAFGIEGRDFEWEGEAYASRILMNNNHRTRQRNGVGLFNAQVFDGKAAKWVYYTGPNHPIYNFAQSEAGRNLVIWPYKDDLSGKGLAAFNGGIRNIKQELNNTARGYYYYFIFDEESDIMADWDAYINALHEIGLQEYMDYLENCEEVRR